MRILEVCEFSAGICGVWTRVRQEASEFARLGYKVHVFSSNRMQGSDDIAKCDESLDGIKIRRFSAKQGKFLTRNVTFFNFDKEIIKLKPDVIITHTIHPHSFKALSYALKSSIPCYLVTHAPFNVRRSMILSIAKVFYDIFNRTSSKLQKFTKIIAVTKWEIPYLLKLGVGKEKIVYIPNGLPDEFFKQKKIKTCKDVLFLGRISPVKDIETLISAAKSLPNLNFSIVGSAEQNYLKKLNARLNAVKNAGIYPPVYDLKKKIRLIDEHMIFVLPSKREAMPQALLEAMARGKIAISSKTDGGKEIIQDGKTGFLFEIGDYRKLAEIIKNNINGNKRIQRIQRNAARESRKYAWKSLIKFYTQLFNTK